MDIPNDSDLAKQDKEQQKKVKPVPPKKEVTDWKGLQDLDSLPLMKSGYSLEADMKFGWKP